MTMLIALLFTLNTYAFRCSQKLVLVEHSYSSVIEKCGEPNGSESYSKQACFNSRVNNVSNRGCTSVQMDLLVYKRNGMTHTLIFQDKVLKTIESCRVC